MLPDGSLDFSLKHCPNCRLGNPDSAMRCDCGFDFESHSMKESYLSPKERHVVRNTSISALVVIGVLRAVVLLDKGDWGGACLIFGVYAFLIGAVLVWRKYLAIRWRRLTWR